MSLRKNGLVADSLLSQSWAADEISYPILSNDHFNLLFIFSLWPTPTDESSTVSSDSMLLLVCISPFFLEYMELLLLEKEPPPLLDEPPKKKTTKYLERYLCQLISDRNNPEDSVYDRY